MGPRLHDGRMGRGQSLLLLGTALQEMLEDLRGRQRGSLLSGSVVQSPGFGKRAGPDTLIVVTVRTGLDARSAPAYWVS